MKINQNYRYVEHYSPKEGVEKDVVLFIAEKISGEMKPQEEEVQKIQWLTYEEAMESNKIN